MFDESWYRASYSWEDTLRFLSNFRYQYVVCADVTMDARIEQGECIKFCANLRNSATETLAIIKQVLGEQCMTRTRVFE